MKVKDILNLYPAFEELSNKSMTFSAAKKIFDLKKKIIDNLSVVDEQEQKIKIMYVKKDADGLPVIDENKQYVFENTADRGSFIRSMETLHESEVNDIKPVKIRESDLFDDGITPNTMYILRNIITFTEG